MRIKRGVFVWAAVGIAVLAAAGAYWQYRAPRILSVEMFSFSPGEAVLVRGENFGDERGDRSLLLDASPLTQSSYLSWKDDEIRFLVPPSVDSALVRVATPFGKSNPEILIHSDRIPLRPANTAMAAAGPSILAIHPAEGAIGSLVELKGINFGSDVLSSSVKFSRNTAGVEEEGSALSPAESAEAFSRGYVEPENPALMYERWDDKSIALRVPEGAGSGAVIVSTPQGDSAPFSFRVPQASGSKYLYRPAVYSLQMKVQLRKKNSRQKGTIVLYLPNPASGFSQRLDSLQDEALQPFMGDYGQAAVYKLSDFADGEAFINRTALVTVYSVETDLAAYSESFSGGQIPPFLQAYAAGDSLVPAEAKEMREAAAAAGKEKNLQRKAAAIRVWLEKNIAWKADPAAAETPLSALQDKEAGSRSYALIACALFRAAGLPALPVAGFIVRQDGQSVPHFWLEYYLPAVGWIPYDPVLALGARPMDFDAGFEDYAHYFGSMDNRHIAVSRGLNRVAPLLGGTAIKTAQVPWSFQTLFEESTGADFETAWGDMEITASY